MFHMKPCFGKYPSHLTPSASSGTVASFIVALSIVQPSYPVITLLSENPSFVRPINKYPHFSESAIMTPVCRIRQALVGASYMIPKLYVTDLFNLGNFPVRRKRKSRIL